MKYLWDIVLLETKIAQPDEKKCKMTKFRFATITGKYITYRGKTQDIDGVHYVIVEEYLKGLR